MRPLVDEEIPLRRDPRGRIFDRAGGAAIFLLALGLRLAYVRQLTGTPLFTQLVLDPLYYHDWARRILAGDWLSGRQVFEQSPLYAYILAAIYGIAGEGLLAPRIVQAFVGAGSCLLVFLIARHLCGRPAALAAGLLAAVYAPAIFYDGMIMKTSWAVFLTAAMTAALVRSGGSRRGLVVLAGALLGLASLVRDNLILLAPLLALWLVIDLRVRPRLDAGKVREAASRVACFAAGVLLAVLPVTIRNRAVSGEWILLTAGGGEVFYIGNNPEADGKYSPPPFVRATSVIEHEDFRQEAARRIGHPVTRRESSSYWLFEGLRWLASNPADYLALLGRKVLIFFNGYELPDNQNFYHHRLFVPILKWLPAWAALLPLAAAGAALSLKAWRDLLPLYLIGGGYVATVMLFFNFARFRMPLVPILLVFAGEAIAEIPRLVRMRWPIATAGSAVAAAVVAGAAALLPLSNDPLHTGQSATQLADLMLRARRPAEAESWSRRGIDLLESVYMGSGGQARASGHGVAPRGDPSRPDLGASYYGVLMEAYLGRARIAAASGDPAERLRWLEYAAAAAPDDETGFDALVAWAEALLGAGRVEEAAAPLIRARRIDLRDFHVALLYAQALHRTGRLRQAIDIVEEALAANPGLSPLDRADAHYGLGLIARDLGDIPGMRAHFIETLHHNPRHPRAAWIQQILTHSDSIPER